MIPIPSKQILLFFISILPFFSSAQQVSTLYFIENSPLRHNLNPAFQPVNDFYLSLPVLGFSQFNLGNNSFSFKDVIYKNNSGSQTITFLHPDGNFNAFYNTLKPNTVYRGNIQINLLSFGFRQDLGFWTFSLTRKVDAVASIPKDIFRLVLKGTPDMNMNYFDFKALGIDATSYTEAAFGYALQLDEQWSFGAKLKLLIGTSNVSISNQKLSLQSGIDQWALNANSTIRYSNMFGSPNQSLLDCTISNWFKPFGIGTGIDLGVQYRASENLYLSAAITDLGIISWFKNTNTANYRVNNFIYNGITNLDAYRFITEYDRFRTNAYIVDSLKTAFNKVSNLSTSSKAYITNTTAKLNVGAEYKLANNYLSLGLLSRTFFTNNIVSQELTASVNARPNNWLNTTLSYSLLNGGGSVGAAIGLRTGIIHWFAAADYIPFQATILSLSKLNDPNSTVYIPGNYNGLKLPIPYNTKDFNLSFGMNLVFNASPDHENKRLSDRTRQLMNILSPKKSTESNGFFQPSPQKPFIKSSSNNKKGLFHPKFKQNNCNCE